MYNKSWEDIFIINKIYKRWKYIVYIGNILEKKKLPVYLLRVILQVIGDFEERLRFFGSDMVSCILSLYTVFCVSLCFAQIVPCFVQVRA